MKWTLDGTCKAGDNNIPLLSTASYIPYLCTTTVVWMCKIRFNSSPYWGTAKQRQICPFSGFYCYFVFWAPHEHTSSFPDQLFLVNALGMRHVVLLSF